MIIMLTFVAAFSLSAQGVKRVAILETVDKYDKVDYGVEFQLRAFITDAVNKTEGYEGYDRVDMSQINKEHDFQRTGMVSDSDIKKLGEMTGASSIVVAEAAAYGTDRIIIAAKIINIESGRIENSTKPKVASTNGNGMEVACNEVVSELLGKLPSISSVQIQKPSARDYVDLGLPSGTLWKKSNEDKKYDYNSALNKFGNQLPQWWQCEELISHCTWVETDQGYKVVGINGNFIFLPFTEVGKHVRGGAGVSFWAYKTSTNNPGVAPTLCIYYGDGRAGRCSALEKYEDAVRLVKNP